MTKFSFCLVILSLTIFSSCSKSEMEVFPTSDLEFTNCYSLKDNSLDDGKAEFTINNLNSAVHENEALLLTNSSEHALSYHWDFGNGDTSEEVNPKYTYDTHGIYTIKLAITDKYENTREVSHDIVVICLFDGEDHDNN